MVLIIRLASPLYEKITVFPKSQQKNSHNGRTAIMIWLLDDYFINNRLIFILTPCNIKVNWHKRQKAPLKIPAAGTAFSTSLIFSAKNIPFVEISEKAFPKKSTKTA
jgi:hypothetical protein